MATRANGKWCGRRKKAAAKSECGFFKSDQNGWETQKNIPNSRVTNKLYFAWNDNELKFWMHTSSSLPDPSSATLIVILNKVTSFLKPPDVQKVLMLC